MKPFITHIIFLTIVSFLSCYAHAQRTIHGRVIDESTGEPLEQAIVSVEPSGHKKLTDNEGRFTLKTDPSTPSVLEISFIGYKTEKISVENSNDTLTIGLQKADVELKEITVNGNLGSESFQTLSKIDLNLHPARSAQDLLRLVPGLFIAQHQGGGKAEQIFLRGFDADHGTDVNISADGIPVNLVSHAHGQGYADLHFLIPETIADYDFGKGPYSPKYGDFATAGNVAYHTYNAIEKNMVKLEGGEFNTLRSVVLLNLLGEKAKRKRQSAYIAGEGLFSNGPFHFPEHFYRLNLFGKFTSQLNEKNKMILTASTLSSKWRASGEIPNRAVAEGYIKDRFGVIDSAQGGFTSRTNVSVKFISDLKKNMTWENQAYYTNYFFNLISNFTFYYFYPATGDEFRQHEARNLFGYNSKISKTNSLGSGELLSSAGFSLRYDNISPSYLAHAAKGTILSYIQLGNIRETAANVYLDEKYQSGNWLLDVGARIDYLHFYYDNLAPASDTSASVFIGKGPTRQKMIASPKINIQYSISSQLQFYLKAGKGFHSNDARIVVANKGYEVLPAAYGMDLGVDWKPVPNCYINAALWGLYLQQEFTYGADLGDQAVSPGGKTIRTGIDISARYQFNQWLYGFVNVNLARPRLMDSPKGQQYLPLAPTFTSTAGLDVKFKNGINGSISYRYMHDRPANESYTLIARGYWIYDLTLNYTRKRFETGIAIENLFNIQWNESEFEYVSVLKNETSPVDDVSYTPGTPFFAKLKFAIFF